VSGSGASIARVRRSRHLPVAPPRDTHGATIVGVSPGPELFVVCKSCGSEVSPYITECPYCGARLRKRAPKIERERPGKPPKRMPRPTLGPLRAGEIPGIRLDPTRRPYVTIVLIALSLFGLLAAAIASQVADIAIVVQPVGASWWKAATSPFIYVSTWYQLAALVAIGIYGWRLERRLGPLAVIGLFVLCGMGGCALAAVLAPDHVAIGGNGAALGLLACWAVPELVRELRGVERDGDLLATAVFAVGLLAMPAATSEASPIAGAAGLIAGGLLGLLSAQRVARH
jgi:membrane associated rhomboid family serine protease